MGNSESWQWRGDAFLTCSTHGPRWACKDLGSYKLNTQRTKATLHRWPINPLQTDHELPGDWSCHWSMQGLKWGRFASGEGRTHNPDLRGSNPTFQKRSSLHRHTSTGALQRFAASSSALHRSSQAQRDPSAWLWFALGRGHSSCSGNKPRQPKGVRAVANTLGRVDRQPPAPHQGGPQAIFWAVTEQLFPVKCTVMLNTTQQIRKWGGRGLRRG